MAAPTGTFQTYQAIGNREDLSDVIHDVSPMETPLMTNVTRGSATATLHEFQTDSLAAASADNKVIEGDDATTDTASPTVRYANVTQISDKVPRVSGTQRAVQTAGRADEMSYQIAKRGRELKRDIERRLCSDQAASVATAATARECAGLGAWLWNNQVKTAGAQTTIAVTAGAPATDPTAGSAVQVTEQHLKDVVEACWTDGGDASFILCGANDKQFISAFSGIATQYRDNPQVGPGVIIAASDVYVSDFGNHNIVATRFSENDIVYALDLEYWKVCYLRPIQQKALAKTGDSDRVQLLAEYTLEACAPESSGKIYTTSGAS